jgi:hypothetical protein
MMKAPSATTALAYNVDGTGVVTLVDTNAALIEGAAKKPSKDAEPSPATLRARSAVSAMHASAEAATGSNAEAKTP